MSKTLNNVEIFASGTWNGMKFTTEDLEEIAKNTEILLSKGRHKPPLKLGHSETQILKGQADGDPAMGWIENVKVKANKLVADFINVPNVLVSAFREGLYRQVSVEMRHIDHTGWILSAVAILGADLPAVKTLQDIEAFLSERIKPDTTGVIEEALCFTTMEPIISGDKMENVEQSKEIEALKAQLAEIKIENSSFKEKEVEGKFSQAKSAILESYESDVKEGKLSPALCSKISDSLDKQRSSFSEGSELTISAELVKELTVAYSSAALPKEEVSSSASFSSSDLRIDERIEREIAKTQASSGKDYFASQELVFKANPELQDEYKAFTLNLSEGRI